MKKQRNKAKAPAPKLGAPVFLYFSKCCNVKAVKPALCKTAEKEGTLGTWRCTGCGKKCTCNRTVNKKEEPKGDNVE